MFEKKNIKLYLYPVLKKLSEEKKKGNSTYDGRAN